MFVRSLLFPLLFLLVACRAQSDLGHKCVMYKSQKADSGMPPVDGGIIVIKESELKEGANKDFISFGSTDCEDFTCVRDSSWVRGDAGPDDPAEGYCSKVCNVGSACPAEDPLDDNKADKKLACRALLLDEKTLAALCASSGDAGASTGSCAFKSSTYCARGSAPDAGI